jgi:flagellar basal body rod protein FlgG
MAAATSNGQTTTNPAAVTMGRVTDFSQGGIEPTGNPYNLAIEGKGFFEVKEANGTTTYTRNGSFALSSKGQLLTSDGASVLNQSGSPVMLSSANGGAPTIGTDGTISINGESKGKIGVAHFDDPTKSLQATAYGRFSASKSSDVKQGPAAGDQVIQNSLEQSNANPIQQMADMIQAARLYEANSKSMKAVDDNQNQLINALGAPAQA